VSVVALFSRNWSYALSPKALEHRPGEKIGPFTLERALGKGAAAEVWLALESGELGFTKRQALKLLQPPSGELEEQKEALLNEARVCGLLKHPGIVDVYKVDSIDGKLFIAMEFVDGPDLNTLLHALRVRDISLPVGAAIEIALELCEALDYAHNACDTDGQALDIIHRDLKPSNVLVDRIGCLKITDWGLVKSHVNIGATTRGVVKGTPGYIAPEVWGGTREFKPAGDLFAVGAILYEAVQGKRLFEGSNLGRIAVLVARRDPREEAKEVADRCPDLVPILERLLQRHPEDRYASASQIITLLRTVRDKYPPRESFKAFIREHADLIEEIAPRKGKDHNSEAKRTARHAATIADQDEKPEIKEDHNPEDSLWDGSIEDGEAQEDLAATVPIPLVVATRNMPGVRKDTVPPGTEVQSLPSGDDDDLFEGMEREEPKDDSKNTKPREDPDIQTERSLATPKSAGSDIADPADVDDFPTALKTAPVPEMGIEEDEEEEVTQIEALAPTENTDSEGPEVESEGGEQHRKKEGSAANSKPRNAHRRRRKRRKGRNSKRHLQERIVSMVAVGIAMGGISLLITGIAFVLLW
jgi:serine/threonine protein kinase